MRIRGFSVFGRGLNWLRGRFEARAAILLYHRVEALDHDPQLLAVSPEYFSGHLAYLSRHHRVVGLADLVKGLEENPDRVDQWLAVTFDDGYADNLWHAKPILERYQVPATVFVASGYVGRSREFWWDELERLFLQPSILPSKLSLSIQGQSKEWELADVSRYNASDSARHRGWNITNHTDPTPRHRVYRDLCAILRPLPGRAREEILRDLHTWADCEHSCRESHRVLRRDEVKQLGSGGFVEVGAHTVSHDVLAELPATVQQEEIRASRVQLENMLDKPVESFAYPYGTKSDYTPATTAFVREAGFRMACSNFPEPIRAGSDIFQLPRFIVRNWGESEFASTLRGWVGR